MLIVHIKIKRFEGPILLVDSGLRQGFDYGYAKEKGSFLDYCLFAVLPGCGVE